MNSQPSLDLYALAAVILLAAVQVGIASVATLRVAGPKWVLGPRDTGFEVPGVSGRLVRAHRNLLESLPQFIGALLCVHAAGSVSSLTVYGAWVFFAARVLYIPAYVSAIPWLRPFFWQVAFFATMTILADAFLP